MDGSRCGHEYLDRRFKFKSISQMVPPKRRFANFSPEEELLNIENHNPESSLNFTNGSS